MLLWQSSTNEWNGNYNQSDKGAGSELLSIFDEF